MLSQEDMSFPAMKEGVKKAGNLLYQYRACRRDAATIWDIENLRHGVVYARTPLLMNDPFDSQVGFSAEKVYDELISFLLDQINPPLETNLRAIFSSLLKYRMVGKTVGFFKALNSLKKYILVQSAIAHIAVANLQQFVLGNADRLYKKCPVEVKQYFTKETFATFALLAKSYHNVEIEEKVLVDALKMDDLLESLEKKVLEIRDKTYIPFIKDFLSKLTITCFSASGWDNQLMWSHYASSYSGICVEYDFEKMHDFIGFLFPVEYSAERPTLSLGDLGLDKMQKDENGNWKAGETKISAILSYLLAKNKCWAYEEEWRIINQGDEPNKPIFIDVPFVKSITLGLNLDDLCKHLICDVCKEKGIECYQLVINQSNYSLTREPLTEEDFAFDAAKEFAYINLLSKHTVTLQEKGSSSTKAVAAAIEKGEFDADATINMLSSTLDFLSDIYFLKASFNRCCINLDTQEDEIAPDTQIGTAIIQMNDFIEKAKTNAETVIASIPNILLSGKISINEFREINDTVKNILEMVEKHKEYPWYSATEQSC